ncbi:cytochrome P450 [Subtercola endophyticus]|uniref:cytochrome P450 n=1 Tax=Subtercola endophyticus TaxID=2895559 RepID=UPI001E569315|nr:cytochrome P450 [Subtercola endophyticus]UFS58322.1 cytochrome P450 [Subtercola endophyticus]
MSTITASNVPLLLSPEGSADPYAVYRALRADDPVHYDESTESFLITRHADVAAAYRNPVFTSRNYEWQLEPVFGRSLLQLEGREHARKRALVSPNFKGEGLESWMPLIRGNVRQILDGGVQNTVDGLIETMEPGKEVDLLEDFAHHLPVSVIMAMLDLPKEDESKFLGWYGHMIAFLANLTKDPEVHSNGIQARVELREYLDPIIQQRRANPGTDLISTLATAEVEGERLSDEEVKTHATQLLNAGAETTDKTFGSIFRHILTDRSFFEAVRDDRSLVTPVISETLRVTPPSQMNGRVVSEDVEVQGVAIPAGSLVHLVMASANRDERRFEHAETFDPYRTDFKHDKAFSGSGEHFAFGFGVHACVGAMLAKNELEIGVNALLDRFPDMRLADGFVPVEEGVKMRAPQELRVVL